MNRVSWWAIALLAAQLSAAGAPSEWRVVGQAGGPVQAVAVQDDLAYVAVGRRLAVLDVSDPALLRELGLSSLMPDFSEGLAVNGSRAYVAAGAAGLRIFNVADRSAPVEIGAWTSPGFAESVAVAGNYAYVADGAYGVRILDVSDAARPVEVAALFPVNYAFRVVVRGRYAYIASAGAGLLIADVNDPRHPKELSSIAAGYARSVAVAGDYAYVASLWGGVSIVEVSDPAKPRLAGSYTTPGWAFDIVVNGDAAWLADGFHGLAVLSLADPLHPVETARADYVGGHAAGIALTASAALVADRNYGLRALGRADARPLAGYAPVSDAWGVTLSGARAYVSAMYRGLHILDVADPSRPVELGAYDANGAVFAAAVSGDYAYLAVGGGGTGGGVQIVNVSDPARPVLTGFFPVHHYYTPGTENFGIVWRLAVVGTIAYVPTENTLLVLDVSDPARPVPLSNIPAAGAMAVAVRGSRVYVSGQEGFGIVDVSDPRNPVLLGWTRSVNSSRSVGVFDNYAYVGDTNRKQVSAIDISDEAHPKVVGSYRASGVPLDLTVVGRRLCLANSGKGVEVLDLANPAAPALTASYETPGLAGQAFVSDPYIFLADGANGLVILDPSGQPPAVLPSPNPAAPITPSVALPAPLPPSAPGARAPHEPVVSGTVCLVTSAADSAPGALRDCLEHASPGDVIRFDPAVFSPESPARIVLATPLPPLSRGDLTIDASAAGVILSGERLNDPAAVGLSVASSDNIIRGIQVESFRGVGILVADGAARNLIAGVTIGGGGRGVVISGPGADDNVVSGGHFGTDAAGLAVHANQGACIEISAGARRNRIGGTGDGDRNVVGVCPGIEISGEGTSYNTVVGNYIGAEPVAGSRIQCLTGPCFAGSIHLLHGASRNRIGGDLPAEANILNYTVGDAINVDDWGTNDNEIIGNFIGLDPAGNPRGGHQNGIWVDFAAAHTIVRGNTIGGNTGAGLIICNAGSNYTELLDNRIGVDPSGLRAVPNRGGGVQMVWGARFARIERNLISGNGIAGNISINGQAGEGNWILGNRIGPDASGTAVPAGADLTGSFASGLRLSDSVRHNFVGGAASSEGNTIAGNPGPGISIQDPEASANVVMGNQIGGATPNLADGVWVSGRAELFQGNTIANNQGLAVSLFGGASVVFRRNSIYGNGGGITGSFAVNVPDPAISAATRTTVRGSACPRCEVEIYSDSAGQGRWFEGSTTADSSGAFSFTLPSGAFRGPNLTVTATLPEGPTSRFSRPLAIP